ncbi:MAG: antitoxin [Kiritimatiellia bacterium]
MKTTLELPDDLIRAMKLRALDEGRKLKDMAAELIRRGLEQPATPTPVRRRVKLPLIVAEPGAPAFSMTGEDIDRVLAEGEAEGLHDPS